MTDPSSPADQLRCPVTGYTLPSDGTPLQPSPFFAERRQEGKVHPLRYADGHVGKLVTDHALARAVLSDQRFSQLPRRFPLGPADPAPPPVTAADLRALASGDLLVLDGAKHDRIRKTIRSRFTVKAARGHRETIRAIAAEQVDILLAQPKPADLTEHVAEPISARVHAHVLGIPAERVQDYIQHYVHGSSAQATVDFVREIVGYRRTEPGDDVISDLVDSGLTDDEVVGLAAVLMSSGRDSVAYTIATTAVALLTHPDQRQWLTDHPSIAPAVIEEFLRYSTMFVALFPRTAIEDLEIDGERFQAGETVSVSPVSANRDADRFPEPERFDLGRDAFGHLSFGFGPHGCAGQQLARVEITEAIGAVFSRVPSLALVGAEQLRSLPFAHVVPTYRAGAVTVTW
ncbi:cytochrome P450 [Kribbella catacumbae]|uniref:cytochrome P450 n=1 Tax=Kribbella catacumbae TaxID=460086 RepID=UPI0006869542|nr:cytochrome P450 [Kribbella catacumbae]